MRKPVIAGNWKMHKLIAESVQCALALKSLVVNANHCEVVIAPAFVALKTVADRLEGSNIKLAGQNCSTESKHGAHTGEVAADMIRDAGASHVIIGHSERRQMYCETDATVNLKIAAALAAKLNVIFCVGETLAEREAGNAEAIVREQLSGGMRGLTISDMNFMIVAYEPIWAIGTGHTATPHQAGEMHRFIRKTLAENFDKDSAERMRIIYGGSVKPENVASLMKQPDIDGALVGGACLEAESFAKLVHYNAED